MIVMLLGGLWHGASWTFVVWGLYHGLLLVIHRIAGPYLPDSRWLRPIYVAGTFLAVCVGWVFFRAVSFHDAAIILERMFVPTIGAALGATEFRCVVGVVSLTAIGYGLAGGINLKRVERAAPAMWLGGALAAILITMLALLPEEGRAFLYFQF
jgi:alginate O-acetyltransferase complex protein AlgI